MTLLKPKRYTSRSVPVLAAVAVMGIILTGCTTGVPNPETGTNHSGAMSTDTIRTSLNADPTTFAPFAAGNVNDFSVENLLFDTLVVRGADNSIVSSIATKWSVTPTQGVFTIRKDATCADGTPITPEIVANSLEFFANPVNKARYRQLALGDGSATVTADAGAGTVTVDLSAPWTDLLQGLSLPGAGIICPAGLKDVAGLAAGTVEGAFSGPYTLAKKQPGVSYEFALRKDYKSWPQYKPALKGTPAATIVATVDTNASSLSNELLTGTKDVAVVRGKDMTRFTKDSGFGTQRYPEVTDYAIFNERPGQLFESTPLRVAVAQVISAKAFLQATSGGLAEPYYSFAPPTIACANTDKSLLVKQDIAAAKTTLSGVKIRIVGANITGPNGAGNTYIADALRAVGADVQLSNVDVATWITTLRQKPDAWDVGIFASLDAAGTMNGSLNTIVGASTDDGGLNMTGSSNEKLEQLAAKAMTQTPGTDRCATYAELQKTVLADAHAIPLGPLPVQATARPGFAVQVLNGSFLMSTLRVTK